ncbi:hypothetical protein ACHAXN_005985 [Cyclotella atomus]
MRSLLHLLHLLLFISVSSSLAQSQHHDINRSIDVLKSAGVVGLGRLCHPSSDLGIPKCRTESEFSSIHLRGSRYLMHSTRDTSSVMRRRLAEDKEEHNANFYIINIGGTVISILFVALIAGMFLGFLTLDVLDIRIKMQAAVDPAEREAAAAIYPLVNQNHRLLVTLLLMNAVAYECLPLFLDALMPTYLTIVFSVTVLLVFGEILPSAIFTGPDQLVLASKLAPWVKFFMTALHPLSHPLVKLMDRLVPEDPNENEEEYNRAELSALVRIQYEERIKAQKQRDMANNLSERGGLSPPNNINGTRHRKSRVQRMANQLNVEKQRKSNDEYQTKSTRRWRQLKEEIMAAADQRMSSDEQKHHKRISSGGLQSILRQSFSSDYTHDEPMTCAHEQIAPPLEGTEVKVVEGALNMKTMCALDVYTPIRMIYSVPEDMVLTQEAFAEIFSQGYSRVPVYEVQAPPNENKITAMKGVLMARQLIMVDWEDARTVSTLPLYIPPCVSPRMNLVTLLHLLRKGGSLIAFVCAGPHLAERALNAGKAIPAEAGFMGIVTLQDVLESVLQERIYDEEDIAQRHLAGAVLTQWAASIIQKYMKRRRVHRLSFQEKSNTITQKLPDNESTPLLSHSAA